MQEAKRVRHQQEVSTQSGINYVEDIVVHLIGIDPSAIEQVELKEKKIRKEGVEGEEEE